MGQTANTITLRKHKKSLHLLNANSKSFLYGFNFSILFKNMLNKKGISIADLNLNFSNSTTFLNINLYFKTQKINAYRNKINSSNITSTKNISIKEKNFSFSKLINNQFKITKNSLCIIKLKNLNKEINLREAKKIYSYIKRFISLLFIRRFNLFIDFIKTTSLLQEAKINATFYLFMLAQIFRVLSKKRHSVFLFFIKFLFNNIIKNSQIKGIKFIVNGKLRGKARSGSSKILIGTVPIQSINMNIEFSKIHIYTLYGVFGFKIWINYKN